MGDAGAHDGRGAAVAVLVASIALIAGCADPDVLHARLAQLRAVTDEASARGAYVCAPRELALARANVRFAEADLDWGNFEAARDHLALAEANAYAARRASPVEPCREGLASRTPVQGARASSAATE